LDRRKKSEIKEKMIALWIFVSVVAILFLFCAWRLLKIRHDRFRKSYEEKIDMCVASRARATYNLEKQALSAWQCRHNARMTTRAMMTCLERAFLAMRDWIKYGNPNGPTFDQLKSKYHFNFHTIIERSTAINPIW
jgi:hypothetical protein